MLIKPSCISMKYPFELHGFYCGDAQPVGDVFNGETRIREKTSRRVEQGAPLARSAVRSENADFPAEVLQCRLIATTSFPLDTSIPLAAAGWQRGATGWQRAAAVSHNRRWLVALLSR